MTSYYAGLSPREVYEKKCGELRCRKNSEICRILSDVPGDFNRLKTIDLSKNFLGPRGILPLLEIIRCSKNMRCIDFRDQHLDDDAVDAICLALRKHPSVTEINLSNNPLTMSSGVSLLQLLKNNPVIEEIILLQNNIRPSMLLAIHAQLKKNRSLKDKSIFGDSGQVFSDTMGASDSRSGPGVLSGTISLTDDVGRGFPEKSIRNRSNAVNSSNKKSLKMYDVEAVLLSFPHTLHEFLFDENPVPVIAKLCEEEHACFYDTQFAADDESVHDRAKSQYGISSWRRVGDIYPSAMLFPDGADGGGVTLPQNCLLPFSWVFTCVGAVFTDLESLRNSVLCSPFGEQGVYSLRVHIDGDWRYVVVDDFLPVNSRDELIFVQPVDGKYFWPCILEKAVAKLHGGYTTLDLHAARFSCARLLQPNVMKVNKNFSSLSGQNQGSQIPLYAHHNDREASCVKTLCDLSGGVGFVRFLHHEGFQMEEWWVTMLDFYNAGALIVGMSAEKEKTLSGIEPCHAYRVVQVHRINGVRLVALLSPWATTQWKGDWSSESVQWDRHADLDLVLRGKNDSQMSKIFWMSYVDFIRAFSQVHICHLFNGFNSYVLKGEWDRKNAGGSYFGHQWHLNPHYRLNIKHESPIFINVALSDTRFTPTEIESLALHIIQKKHYPLHHQPNAECDIVATRYVATDSISFEGVVAGGENYWVVPSSHMAGVMGKFILRIFTHSGFVISKEDISSHWNTIRHVDTVESSGEYCTGDDNSQINLSFDNFKNFESSESKTQTVFIEVRTLGAMDFALGMFLVNATMKNDIPSRSIGALNSESVVASNTLTVGNSAYLETEVCFGQTYNLVVCVSPVGSRAELEFIIWSSQQSPKLTSLPVWDKKTVSVSWPQGSGSYYEVTKNPQIEIYRPKLQETFIVRMQLKNCSCSNPAVVLFVLANNGRQGEGIKGAIPADRVIARSKYVRHSVVQCEFELMECMDSMLIVPCLQPPGSLAECTITAATETGDFAIRVVSTG